LTVATTASAHNLDFMKNLGATFAFNHKDPNVITNILKIVKAGDVAYDCIGTPETQLACAEILSKIGGGILPTVCLVANAAPFPNVELKTGKLQAAIYYHMLTVRHSNGLGPRRY